MFVVLLADWYFLVCAVAVLAVDESLKEHNLDFPQMELELELDLDLNTYHQGDEHKQLKQLEEQQKREQGKLGLIK